MPNFLLAEMTVEHVKVVLTGEGADELFAGYEYLREIRRPRPSFTPSSCAPSTACTTSTSSAADRVTMAHGLEARVPFLDREVIAHALAACRGVEGVGARAPGEAAAARRVRRLAARRRSCGARRQSSATARGAADVLTSRLEDDITEGEFERERGAVDPPLRDHAELAYYRIFAEHLPGIRPERMLGRFATV